MSSNRFLTLINGVKTLVTAIASSAGVADANKIIMTGTDGRLSSSFMPSGIGAQTVTATASETLAAGDYVNVFDNAGTPGVRKADNSNNRPANGFVLSAVANAASATVHASGINTARTGMIPGTTYYLGTAGNITTTAPSAAGTIVQVIGIPLNATNISFDLEPPITIV